MKRVIALLFGILLAVGVVGCSPVDDTGSTSDQSSVVLDDVTSGPTVVIQGKAYTCAEIIESAQPCGSKTQEIFNQHKERIDQFVNSGKLGVFNDGGPYSYADTAFAGLVACTWPHVEDMQEQQQFIDYIQSPDAGLSSEPSGVELLAVWFGAHRYLCQDDGYVTKGDMVLP